MRVNRKDLAEMAKRTKQSKEDRESALNPQTITIDDGVEAVSAVQSLPSGNCKITSAIGVWTAASDVVITGSPIPPPLNPTPAQKRKQLKAMERLEKVQAKKEEEYWQKRDQELANIKVDKSKPFLGLADVMFMLKSKR